MDGSTRVETYWTRAHYRWLAEQKFEHPAHQIVFQDYINAIHDGEKRQGQLIKQIEKLLPHWSNETLGRRALR